MTVEVKFMGAWADFQTEAGKIVVEPGCTRDIRADNNVGLVVSCGEDNKVGTIKIQHYDSLLYLNRSVPFRVILGKRHGKDLSAIGSVDLRIGKAEMGIVRGGFAHLELGGERVATVRHVPNGQK